MKEVKYFKCDYCRKKYKNKRDIIKHEKECVYNPDNKRCGSCSYYVGIGSWCEKNLMTLTSRFTTDKECMRYPEKCAYWTDELFENEVYADRDVY